MIRITDNLWRGPRPDLQTLKDDGFNSVLDLESGLHDHFNKDTYEVEEQHPQDFGIQLIHIPMSDFTPPSGSQLSLSVQFMKMASPTNKLYVHCLSGKDRTGMVCAKYRMEVQGWTKAQAVAEMKALGMHVWYYWWIWFL